MSTSGFGRFLVRQARNSTTGGASNARNNNSNGNNNDTSAGDNNNQGSSSSSSFIPLRPSDLRSNGSTDATHGYTTTTQNNNNNGNRTGTGNGRAGGPAGAKEPDNILNSEYARKRRELLELVRDLRALGHDKDLDIPQIAVIGKQSAGKSSLVEAVAGINVPRDAGTCTRCPMECTMLTSSDQWSCSISLRGDGTSTAFSPDLTDKSLVELWIRRAQAAVLCPHLDRERFKKMSREGIKKATDCSVDPEVRKFSNTVVEVKILDPEGTDLVFVDLPGLIPNADDDVVSQVENMVNQYISLPSTIILVTVPAEDDLENQKAMKLAKDADPHGTRTIAVVTKADKIGAGETGRQDSWRDIFAGRAREHKLRLGYYAVRLPTDEERARKVTAAQIRAEAVRVFDTVAPWPDVKALPGPTRLGVRALLRDISPLLMRMLVDAIPRLKTAVAHLLAACLAALSSLPARPAWETADSISVLVQLLFRFCEAVRATVDGTGDDKAFVHRSVAHYRLLKHSIRRTAPDFRPFERPGEYVRPPEPLTQRREDEFAALGPLPVADAVAASMRSATPLWGPEDDDVSEVDVQEAGPSRAASGDEEDLQLQGMMGLLDVRRVIQESTGWELPHNVPYLAKTRLIREFVRRWGAPAQTCFAGIRGVVEQYVYDTLVPAHFDQFPSLKHFVVTQVREHIGAYLARSQVAVQLVLAREELPYFTQNGHYLETTRDVWLGHYKEVRKLRNSKYRIQRYSEHYPRPVSPPSAGASREIAQAVAAIRALSGYSDVSATDLPKLLPTDEFIDELIVMADVRSYFQVAYKRVIDNVPQTIHHDFVQGFAYALQPYLLGKLGLGAKDASERVEKLLEEDPAVSRKRRYLEDRKKRLEDMKVRLDVFSI